MEPRIVELLDEQGNPVYELGADGNPKTDNEGNPIIKMVETYDKEDVDTILREREELSQRIAKLEEDNKAKDENFRKMRSVSSTPAQAPSIDVEKVVEEQLKKRDAETSMSNARQLFSTRFGGEKAKVDAAMMIFNKLFSDDMGYNDAVNASIAAVSPQVAHTNWTGGGSAGVKESVPSGSEDFSKSPDRSYAYREVSSQLNKLNIKDNKLWNKPTR
jgi:hypothetical protein